MRQRSKIGNYEVKKSDIELFTYLYKVKVATREQLTRDCYKELQKEAIYKRLRKFCDHHLLQNIVAPGLGNKRVYSVTKKTFDQFIKQGDESELNFTSEKLGHDLTLVDLRTAFLSCPAVKSYYTENELKTWHGDGSNSKLSEMARQNSDGCVALESNGERLYLPLELELSRQNPSKNLSRFTTYQLAGDIHTVLVVFSDQNLVQLYRKHLSKITLNKTTDFYFTSLQDITQSGRFIFESQNGEKIDFGPGKLGKLSLKDWNFPVPYIYLQTA